MKRIFAVAVCGFVALAAGCASTKTDASAGMVKGEKACGSACTEGKTCSEGAKAAPGMVAGEKKACSAEKSGCSASSSGCSEKKAN